MMTHHGICRVCSSKVAPDDEAYNLLELPDLAEKFSDCTNLVVDPMEHQMMPSEVCCECYEQLEKFHAFRALCILTDHRWRSGKWSTKREIDRDLPLLDVEAIARNKVEEEEESLLEAPELILCDGSYHSEESALLPKLRRRRGSAKDQLPLYKCDICSDEFTEEKRLLTHRKEHEGQSLYHCTEPGCEETFNRYETMRQHELGHAEKGTRFTCEHSGCDKMYRHKTSLISHMRKAHQIGKPLKTHMCEFCGRVFKNQSALTHHRFTHRESIQLPYECEMPDCSLRFHTKQKLKVHMMRHKGIKNYSCPYCGLKKTTKNELRLHINFHTLERTWSCSECPKVCNSSSSLNKHIRAVHEKAKDYACSYCEKSFATSHTRKYHEMTHTGEKNFECHECGKRFTQPAALRTHRSTHARNPPPPQPQPQPQPTILRIVQVTSLT